jgi:exopolysaccharide production protein ExoZ
MLRFRSIQVLRAIAALSVVAFHLSPAGFTVGAAGVDIFFVISGFIMGSVGRRESPGAFLRKRAIRIVPLYWLVTLAMCGGALIPGVFQNFRFDAASLARSLLFIPYVDPTGHVWPLVVSGWTLNDEVLFYALFAIGLLAGRPVLVSAAGLLALVVLGQVMRPHDAVLAIWTTPLLLEFVAGLALAKAGRLRGVWPGLALLAAGSIGFGVFGVVMPVQHPRLLVWGLPAFAMVAGAVTIERSGRWPALRWAETIGDASYSLYLLHGIVIDIVHKKLAAHTVTAAVATVMASVAAAYISWIWFERPVGRWLGRWLGRAQCRQARQAEKEALLF